MIGITPQGFAAICGTIAFGTRFNALILSGFSVHEQLCLRRDSCWRLAAIAIAVSLMSARRTACAGAKIPAFKELVACITSSHLYDCEPGGFGLLQEMLGGDTRSL